MELHYSSLPLASQWKRIVGGYWGPVLLFMCRCITLIHKLETGGRQADRGESTHPLWVRESQTRSTNLPVFASSGSDLADSQKPHHCDGESSTAVHPVAQWDRHHFSLPTHLARPAPQHGVSRKGSLFCLRCRLSGEISFICFIIPRSHSTRETWLRSLHININQCMSCII